MKREKSPDLHKTVFGKDLDLLHLPSKQLTHIALGKAKPDVTYAFNWQRKHNVIRRAWVLHAKTGADVRDCLDLCVHREYATSMDDGNQKTSSPLYFGLSFAHQFNDWSAALPYFIDQEVALLREESSAGALVRQMISAGPHLGHNPLASFDPDNLLPQQATDCVWRLVRHLPRFYKNLEEFPLWKTTFQFIESILERSLLLDGLRAEVRSIYLVQRVIEEALSDLSLEELYTGEERVGLFLSEHGPDS